jgi:hypothetical protein
MIARQAFPYLKFQILIIIFTISLSIIGSGYITLLNKNVFLILFVVGLTSFIFFAAVQVLMVVFKVEPNSKQINSKIIEIIPEQQDTIVKKGSVKRINRGAMLRGVDEIREYTQGKKEGHESESESEEQE